MRINILEAGLVTFMMAGRGFLPKDDPEPRPGPETESWNSVVLPALAKPAPKAEPR
jgi:hypothetical protein